MSQPNPQTRRAGSLVPLFVTLCGGIALLTALPTIIATLSGAMSSVVVLATTLACAAAASIAGVWFLKRSFANPLGEIASVLEDLSAGEGDLARDLSVQGEGEIGVIGRGYNAFMQRLRQMLDMIRNQAPYCFRVGAVAQAVDGRRHRDRKAGGAGPRYPLVVFRRDCDG